MKISLIIPPGGYYAERWQKGSLMPSLGILYIAAVLLKNGHEIDVIDAHVENLSWKELISRIKKYSPGIAGVTFTTENRFQGFAAVQKIKQNMPDILTIAGGPHVSLAPSDTLLNIRELDFVARGEGEDTVLELANGTPLENINGLSFRMGNKIIHNPDRPLIKNLDSVPFPSWHKIPWGKYNFTLDIPGKGKLRAGNIMTSRGCPFSCNFCSTPKMWGRNTRMRSVDNIMEEIKLLRENYKTEALWIFDDTFTVNRKRVEEFCDRLLRNNQDINWFCEIRVDTVDRDLLTLMKKAGCYSVGFGVESGSQRILDEIIGKKIKLDEVRETANICRELGIISNPFFIFSHPEETNEDIEKTMALIKTWPKPSSISLSILHIYPGTRLEKLAKEKGILPFDFSWARRNDPRVTVIPSAQGHVPIFIDKLSLKELSRYIFQWRNRQGYRLWKKIPEAISNIHSFRDILRYFSILSGYIQHKMYCRRRDILI